MTPKIRLDNVVKIFGKNADGRALSMLNEGASNTKIRDATGNIVGVAGISADIDEGDVFVVMGLSGSGKSTLIRCINRIHEPTAGSVVIDGEDVVGLPEPRMREVRREKTAMVFQHFALFPHKTVLENAAFGLKIQGVDAAAQNDAAQSALEQVGLGQWGDRFPHNLSGGMQQRVGLARALATEPDILLMDEAFSALDPLIRRQMQNEMLTLQNDLRKTIVFITHDLNEALRVGTNVMVMKDGRSVQIGTPTQIVTQPEDDYVAEFMADVDHAKVLTAEFAMTAAPGLAASVPVAEAATRVEEAGAGFVVDPENRPLGLVTPDLLAGAVGTTGSAATAEFAQASIDAPLAALFRLSGDGRPVAITDTSGQLVGMVKPLDLLSSLGDVEVVDDPHGQASHGESGQGE